MGLLVVAGTAVVAVLCFLAIRWLSDFADMVREDAERTEHDPFF